jgi:hypothetical protein
MRSCVICPQSTFTLQATVKRVVVVDCVEAVVEVEEVVVEVDVVEVEVVSTVVVEVVGGGCCDMHPADKASRRTTHVTAR